MPPLPPAGQGLTLEKLYLFHTNSEEGVFYMKIVPLHEIYDNILVLIKLLLVILCYSIYQMLYRIFFVELR
jgi:hypothetical protein